MPHRRRRQASLVDTTVGRVLLWEIVPEGIAVQVVNKVMGKKQLADLIDACYRLGGQKKTVLLADQLRTLGYKHATMAGISICIDDMLIPAAKKHELLDEAHEGSRARSRTSTSKVSSPTASATTRSSTSGRRSPSRSPRR